MALELCVTSKIRAADSFSRTMTMAKQVGFTQIDYCFSSAMLLREDWEARAMADWQEARTQGMTFRYAHLPYDYPSVEQDWEHFHTATCRAVDLAVRFGVECAAIHPRTFMTRDYDAERMRQESLDFLRPYCEYAKQQGLVLALENMRGAGRSADPAIRRYATQAEDVLDLAQTLDMGICWDTGHGHISAQEQAASLRRIGPRLSMLHINDNFAEDDVHLAPFLGRVDWQSVAAALREIGFTGAINLEVNCSGCPLPAREAYIAYMGEAARQLRSMVTG